MYHLFLYGPLVGRRWMRKNLRTMDGSFRGWGLVCVSMKTIDFSHTLFNGDPSNNVEISSILECVGFSFS